MQPPTDTFDRDAKLDGLGIAFFAVVSALLDEVADAHPEGPAVLRRIRSAAVAMATSVTGHVGGLEGVAVRVEALGAIESVFAGTQLGGGAGHVRGVVGPGEG